MPADFPGELDRSEGRRLYGRDPLGYDVGRPEYPERVYEVLVDRCGLGPGCAALEIGPGTGLVTRRLLAAGASVVAVEPHPSLAAYLRDAMADVDVEVVEAAFEDASLGEGAYDLAVAAMSFHWVEQAAGLTKLFHLLRAGGWAALWWTVFSDPERPDPFRESTRDLLTYTTTEFELDVEARKNELARAGFVEVDGELIRWTAVLDSTQVRALYSTMAVVLRRPEPEQARLLDALERVATDQFGGVVERPFLTALYTGRRS